MKVTKEQRVYLGLLGLGLVAFLLDRTVFTPSAADGADSSDLLVARSSATVAHSAGAVAKPEASPTSNPVAQKLAALSDSMHLSDTKPRDAFTPGPAWVVKFPVPAADTKTFEQKHHLDGVMVGRRPAAMIDGKLVAVGEMLDGYKLVAVAQACATLQDGRTTVALRSR